MESFYTFIASIGGGAVVAVAVIAWFGNLTRDKINLIWKQEYEKEIELLKSNFNSNLELLRISLTTFSAGHQYSQERRLQAIDLLWQNIISIRDFISPISTFFSVLLPEEYTPVLNKDPDAFLVSRITDKTTSELLNKLDNIETQRPYLGEYIWGLFFTYRSFMLRISFLFQRGKEKGHIKKWHEDTHVLNMLKTSIGDEDFNKLDFAHPMSILYAINMFEQKILIEVNKLVSGEFASEANYKEAKRLLDLVKNEGLKVNDDFA